ncbi:MAG: trypsin-like peptidase domain-containing protein [Anaerolineae bacterium]
MKRISLMLTLVLVLSLLVGVQPALALDRASTQRVIRSVVQLVAVDEGRGGLLTPKWSGSGTFVSADGLILTNCHVALPRALWEDPEFDYDLLIVALTIRSDEPPQPTYLAQVVQFDPGLDLAVIRVTHMLDGTPVDPNDLNLPVVPLGDSDALEIGDPLYVFGYPGIGGETITLTSGTVSGFSGEKEVKGRAWIKTDATVAGGNSGGTAVNEQGELVAIPTQGGSGSSKEIVDCRYIADTNGDGVIDENDTCVPMGGFINALRPVNLAKPLIEAAIQGLGPQPLPTPGPGPRPPVGEPKVSRLFFAPSVNDADQPVTVVDSFPSGTEDLYLFFDYENFQDGTAWQPVLIYEGETEKDVWPLANWDGGPRGTWWLNIHSEPLADGRYEIALFYAGEEIGSAAITVGGPAGAFPAFSNIVFSGGGEEGYLLPGRLEGIAATFEYANTTPSTRWSYIGYYQGEEFARGDGEPFPNASGVTSLPLSKETGFPSGVYRLELYIEDRLAATSDCVVGREGVGEPFGPITFAEGIDRKGNPVRPGTTFEIGIAELYAIFDYQGMEDGWNWTRRWSIDGRTVVDDTRAWSGGESGKNFHIYVYSDDVLPPGEYRLDLLVEEELVRSGTCSIRGTPRPTPTPVSPQDGVEVYGRITDADTGRGISGAVFVVLQPGTTVDDFIESGGDTDLIYSFAETDRRGDYWLAVPLAKGEVYSWIITAKGYRPRLEDDIHVGVAVTSPYELNITLQRAK